MTNTEIIQAIKAEIERRREYHQSWIDFYRSRGKNFNSDEMVVIELEELLSFLSTLESEKPRQEELEEEIAGTYQALFGTDVINRKEMLYLDTFDAIARHFAQWGAEHLKK